LYKQLIFFTPILDNPYDWGRVAATNALSDIYAMGGAPISSLQLVSWPREDIGFEVLSDVIKGGCRCNEICQL
jgi:selenide,water dikinase